MANMNAIYSNVSRHTRRIMRCSLSAVVIISCAPTPSRQKAPKAPQATPQLADPFADGQTGHGERTASVNPFAEAPPTPAVPGAQKSEERNPATQGPPTQARGGDPFWSDGGGAGEDFVYDCYREDFDDAERRVVFVAENNEIPVFLWDPGNVSGLPAEQQGTILLRRGQVIASSQKKPLGDMTVSTASTYKVARACTAPCNESLPENSSVETPFDNCKAVALDPKHALYVYGCDLSCDAHHGSQAFTIHESYFDGLDPERLHPCVRGNLKHDDAIAAIPDVWWIPVDSSDRRKWVKGDSQFRLEVRCTGGAAKDKALRTWHPYPGE